MSISNYYYAVVSCCLTTTFLKEPELKARIEEFLIERRRNKGKTVDEMLPIEETGSMMEKMDTT